MEANCGLGLGLGISKALDRFDIFVCHAYIKCLDSSADVMGQDGASLFITRQAFIRQLTSLDLSRRLPALAHYYINALTARSK